MDALNTLPVVAVGGTCGKTTVVAMLEHIFRQAGAPHAVVEVSAEDQVLGRVATVPFSCGVLTNISVDHADFPGGLPAYLAVKEAFPSLLAATAPLVVPLAESRCRAAAAAAPGPVVTVAADGEADVSVRVIRATAEGSLFALTVRRQLPGAGGGRAAAGSFIAGLRLLGRHNVDNAALAATAALLHGLPPASVARGLASFAGLPRRLTLVRVDGLTVVDDIALNPASLDAAFLAMAAIDRRLLVVVNAIRGGGGPLMSTANALTLARWWGNEPFRLAVTASADCSGPACRVTGQEKSAFLQALEDEGVVFSFCDTLAAATAAAYAAARPGDLVALLGSQGMDDGLRLFRRLAGGTDAADAAGVI